MKLRIFILALSAALLIFLLVFSYKDIKGNNRVVRYFNDSNFKAASKNFNRELKRLPDNYSILNNAAGTEYKLNKFDEAQTKYNAVLNSLDAGQEEKFIALYGLGNTEYGKNDFRKAAGSYKEALKIKPCDKDAKYNLEVALLKLNEKSSYQNDNDTNKQGRWRKEQNVKQNDQNAGNRKQSKEKHDLKRQKEQSDKAQKENEKKRQSPGVRGEIQKRQNVQKDLEEEKLKLDKQRLEISNKIKALKKPGGTKNKFAEHKNRSQGCNLLGDKPEKEKQYGVLEMQSALEKENKKDMSVAMFLNYYDEADKRANKLRNKNKKPALNQPQEDW
jgi:tetratricopeptide (TPR) repeat protein